MGVRFVFFSVIVCLPTELVSLQRLTGALSCMLQLGGSGVLVQPMTYIFDEEPERWRQLLDKLGLEEAPPRR